MSKLKAAKTWFKLSKNPKVWQRFFIREKVIRAIREFFDEEKFHEVQTPILVPAVIPESYLEVFETYLLDRKRARQRMFLTTSPEASIKKLLVAGLGNCFEITKSFRNTETDSWLHNPEFTLLEWYRVGANYKDIMNDCERLIGYILRKIKSPQHQSVRGGQKSKIKDAFQNLKLDDLKIIYQNHTIDLTPPWERISVEEALRKYVGISFDKIKQNQAIRKVAQAKGYSVTSKNTWEEIFNQIFLNEVEPHLGTHGKPTIIYDYPKPLAALAKIKSSDPCFVERFELYIGGIELADCCSELTDYNEQKRRFNDELRAIKSKNKTLVKPDIDFLEALKYGLPPCAGIALGIDRLIMLFTDTATIKETLLFSMQELINV